MVEEPANSHLRPLSLGLILLMVAWLLATLAMGLSSLLGHEHSLAGRVAT